MLNETAREAAQQAAQAIYHRKTSDASSFFAALDAGLEAYLSATPDKERKGLGDRSLRDLLEVAVNALQPFAFQPHPSYDDPGAPFKSYFSVGDILKANAARAAILSAQSKGANAPGLKTHEYEADPEHPWFCKDCGYPEHEPLKHSPKAGQGEPQ